MTVQADAILAAKLKLERELEPELWRLLTRYVETWVEAEGKLPGLDAQVFRDRLEKILLKHYARTVMVMQGKRAPKSPQLHLATTKFRHMDSLRRRASAQARLTLRSVDKELARELSRQLAPLGISDGTDHYPAFAEVWKVRTKADRVTNVRAGYIGKLKAAAYSTIAKIKARLSTIANVNTNAVAEEARIEVVPPQDANGFLAKTWNSLLDGRERDTHHEAHGQTVPVDEAFEVGESRLRFPGDAELGASLGEIINCRCFLTHTFVPYEVGKKPTVIHVGPSAPTRRYQPLGPGKPSVMRPTSVVTLNGTTNARIVLQDGRTLATLRQPKPNTVEVLVNRRVVARASIVNGRAVNLTVEPAYQGQDIDGLIQRSVEHSAAR